MVSTSGTRRAFLKTVGLGAATMAIPRAASARDKSAERPNILWLVSEDNGPFLGCYGYKNAITPHLDKLAAEGVLYENAFANAPVCAPARSTIITGMYPPSMGTQHMRSKNAIPETIKFFPQYLREAGYYTTNRSKTDYNIAKLPKGTWDVCSGGGHWKGRKKGQPFFSIFNIGTSHESCLHRGTKATKQDPAKVELPPYHPDTPEFRNDWAYYYERITQMDSQMGAILAELEKDGLAEDTIVIYYADHGGVLVRSKRFLFDSGTHVPMIARFPKKYQHLAPGKPGTRTDRLVSFIDLAPSMLSLAGIKIPDYIQGEAFLGRQAARPRDYVYLFRGRMDERYDFARAVRDKKYKYIRNYMPHLPWGQHLDYLWRSKSTQSLWKEHLAGRLKGAEKRFFEPKATEELYDTKADPHEVNNLAGDPACADVLKRMREAQLEWAVDIHDIGFLPEGEFIARSEGSTVFELARDKKKYDQAALMAAADIANARDSKRLGELIKLLGDKDSGVRYWGAIGCLSLGDAAAGASDALKNALDDSCPNVRIAAAESLCSMGKSDKALGVLVEALGHSNVRVALHAANALDYLGDKAKGAVEAMKKAKGDGYVERTVRWALGELGEKMPPPPPRQRRRRKKK
ncbi:MAG: sulfatase-like hydrolase/transferase [Phycisphaerae bacterium]|jgi:arylsulfatase A-like enzyme|nr:sulfatase-like hydrolase/transferase [Phycisphaerae bacterium]